MIASLLLTPTRSFHAKPDTESVLMNCLEGRTPAAGHVLRARCTQSHQSFMLLNTVWRRPRPAGHRGPRKAAGPYVWLHAPSDPSYAADELSVLPGWHTSVLVVAEMTVQGTPASSTTFAAALGAKFVPVIVSAEPPLRPVEAYERPRIVGCAVYWKTVPTPSSVT